MLIDPTTEKTGELIESCVIKEEGYWEPVFIEGSTVISGKVGLVKEGWGAEGGGEKEGRTI